MSFYLRARLALFLIGVVAWWTSENTVLACMMTDTVYVSFLTSASVPIGPSPD